MQNVITEYAKHPKIKGTYSYGTAGFRMKADLLDSIMFTVGCIAVLRSRFHNGKHIGVMVTASHNPEQDNGVKLVEPMGEMLEQSWEAYAIEAANAETGQELAQILEKIAKHEKIDMGITANVVIARDTRPSGEALVLSSCAGVQSMGGKLQDFGILTTPQLHYITRCLNTKDSADPFGEPTSAGYHHKLSAAFKSIINGKPKLPVIHIDAANGVGAVALSELSTELGSSFDFVAVNVDTNAKGVLNHKCGADFVKINQSGPSGMSVTNLSQCCSLDGDADRIVFYFNDENEVFRLLDGDKIAILSAGFIMKKIKQANLKHVDGRPISVGLVQTAYANGSSTSYVKDSLQIPVVFTPTGVKHLHHAATEFDVGVYFEANGHGTVLFSDDAIKRFKTYQGSNEVERNATAILAALPDLINQTVGDALSDLLMIVAILTCEQISFSQWNESYTDLPSRQEKVKVKDRNMFVPIKADTELSEPKGLQERINLQVSKFKKGRCFVRPSGTEDVVRVYAEAETPQETDTLSRIVCGIVFDYYGGVGERPEKFIKTNEKGDV